MKVALSICTLLLTVNARPSTQINLQLLRSAREGDAIGLQQLIQRGALVNFADSRGEDALVHLLSGWHSALDASFPNVTKDILERFARSLDILLSSGADPKLACPLLDAAILSNVVALSRIVSHSTPALERCVVAEDVNGETPIHAVVQSSSAGLARVCIRMHVLNA